MLLTNYRVYLAKHMYEDDGLLHDTFRIDPCRSFIEEFFNYLRLHPFYRLYAKILIGMTSLNCACSLRPVEGLATTSRSAVKGHLPFDSAPFEPNDSSDLPSYNPAIKRKCFSEQHAYFLFGNDQTDAIYVSFRTVSQPPEIWNPRNLPLLGMQIQGRVKNDQAMRKGTRSCRVNPERPTDRGFCLVTYVYNVLADHCPLTNAPIFSGLPLAASSDGYFYANLLNDALKSFAVHHNIDPRRINRHCLRLYGPVQCNSDGQTEAVTANQGGWTHSADKAKGMLVYYRNQFWNHGWHLGATMHSNKVPFTYYKRYQIGSSTALSKNCADIRILRANALALLRDRALPPF